MALAAKVIALVTISSPGPTPAAKAAAWRAAVPEEKATAWGTPQRAATASSKSLTAGPWVSQSPSSTAATAALSSASRLCFE